jgi:hypothetical protein
VAEEKGEWTLIALEAEDGKWTYWSGIKDYALGNK